MIRHPVRRKSELSFPAVGQYDPHNAAPDEARDGNYQAWDARVSLPRRGEMFSVLFISGEAS